MKFSEYDRRNLIRNGYDLKFIADTQPAGNIKIHSGYIEMGNAFVTFLDVYKYPKNNLGFFWLSSLVNQEKVIAFLSIGTQSKQKIQSELDRSISELQSRMIDSHSKASETLGSESEAQKFYQLLSDLDTESETEKKIFLRLMIYDTSLSKLLNHVQEIRENYYAYAMSRFIDEQKYDYQSIFMPLSKQEKMANHRLAKDIEAYDLGGSYMFDYINLIDEGGHYFGFTPTNGAFIFNPFNLKNNNRTRVFSLVAGQSGMGKSTFLQQLNDDAFMRGEYIRNFDVSGEYTQSTLNQKGIIIDTTKEENQVNIFEIFPTVTNSAGNKISEIGSFNQNISRIKTTAHILDDSLSKNDLKMLEGLLNQFYIQKGMWTVNPRHNADKINVLNLPHEQYPTLSEFVIFLEEQQHLKESKISNNNVELESIKNITHTFRLLLEKHSDIFDGHTTIPNLEKERVVTFDMSAVKAMSTTSSDNKLFQAQFFSYLSLISSHTVNNGKKIRQKIKNHQLVDDQLGMNIDYYYINIDETEDYFQLQFPDVVAVLANFMEEMRKNYVGITLAFPTLKDILLSNETGSKEYFEYQQAVNKIFGLIQYYHFFQLSNGDQKAISEYFKRNRSVTIEQLDTLKNLEPHQLLTTIVGERSYRWETQLLDEQLARYK